MSNKYISQQEGYVIGTELVPITLTASFDDNVNVVHMGNKSQMQLYIDYTPAQDGRKISVQIEGSPNGSRYYKKVTSDISSGTETWSIKVGTFTGTTGGVTYPIEVSEPVADKSIRISVKEDGSANFGTVSIQFLKSG